MVAHTPIFNEIATLSGCIQTTINSMEHNMHVNSLISQADTDVQVLSHESDFFGSVVSSPDPFHSLCHILVY